MWTAGRMLRRPELQTSVSSNKMTFLFDMLNELVQIYIVVVGNVHELQSEINTFYSVGLKHSRLIVTFLEQDRRGGPSRVPL